MIDFTTTTAEPGGISDDHYATAEALRLMKGTANVDIVSNTENETTTADDDRIEAALSYADRYIDGVLRPLGFVVPIASPAAELSDIAVQFAYAYLLDPRVFTMDGGAVEGPGRELFFAVREAKRRLMYLAMFGMGSATTVSETAGSPAWE